MEGVNDMRRTHPNRRKRLRPDGGDGAAIDPLGAQRQSSRLRQDNLLAIRQRKFVVTTDSDHTFHGHPNLAQHPQVTELNQLWVADLTDVRMKREFVYLALVLDAHSRRVIGWALEKALASRQPKPGLVHHSDRGSQDASAEYVDRREACGAVLSMSRPGRPWENGRCESFIKTLKQEELDARPYNRVRLHSALAYRSPVEFERQQAAGIKQAEWLPATMSFLRHREIYSDDQTTEKPGRTESSPATHRNEFPAGYSWAGCSPAEPAAASPADGHSGEREVVGEGKISERQV